MHPIRVIIVAWITACVVQTAAIAEEARHRSVLMLDQSDARSPFYERVFASFRAAVESKAGPSVAVYAESLGLNRFSGQAYEESLQQHLQLKYRDMPPDLAVAIGSRALGFLLHWRSSLWTDVPMVFAMVDGPTAARLNLPSDVTGSVTNMRFSDMMTAARAVVPRLQRIVLVGDHPEGASAYEQLNEEIRAAAAGVEVEDLRGLPMRALQESVASLPDHTAILYIGIHSDGEGRYYNAGEALTFVAHVANRPIVISTETELGHGAVGGFLLSPALIGESAAKLALRILDGESPATIPVALAQLVRPIFDWRALQRWGVGESDLPAGSAIRFRPPTAWEQYRWHVMAVVAALLLQSAFIVGLFHERRRRHAAEIETRERMAELAHMNRRATASEMSASIAHELNQPLGAILSNTEAAEMLLQNSSPDLHEMKEILADIRRDDQRASEVIRRLRSLLKKTAFEPKEIDLNETMREAFNLVRARASARNVALNTVLAPQQLSVRGDQIQLQQVILNLIINGMDATEGLPAGQRRVVGHTVQGEDGSVEFSVADSGPGIPPDTLGRIFEPFFTTKRQGMGMGLSIARSIVEAHGGRIWAENKLGSGAVFHINLPLAAVQ